VVDWYEDNAQWFVDSGRLTNEGPWDVCILHPDTTMDGAPDTAALVRACQRVTAPDGVHSILSKYERRHGQLTRAQFEGLYEGWTLIAIPAVPHTIAFLAQRPGEGRMPRLSPRAAYDTIFGARVSFRVSCPNGVIPGRRHGLTRVSTLVRSGQSMLPREHTRGTACHRARDRPADCERLPRARRP